MGSGKRSNGRMSYVRAFFKMDALSATLAKGRTMEVVPTIVTHFAQIPWASAPGTLFSGYIAKHAGTNSLTPIYHMIGAVMLMGVYRESSHMDHEVHELHTALATGMPLSKDPFNQYPKNSPERRAFERHAHH